MERISCTAAFSGGNVTRAESKQDDRFCLMLQASDDAPSVLKEVSVVFRFPFRKKDVLFLNGYQSWTYCPEVTARSFDLSMRYVPKAMDNKYGFSRYADLAFTQQRVPFFELAHQYKKGYSYAYVRRGKHFYLFASLAEDTGFTRIEFRPKDHTVTFVKDCAGRELKPGEQYRALDLFFADGSEDSVFDAWFARMGIKALPASPKTGYTSWYNSYQDISEEQILSDLAGMKTLHRKPDIFQIDDGFERFVGDWLDVDEKKFPNGLAAIAEKIREEGFQPGIWLSPFLCERNSALFREHPEWLLKEKGEPVFAGGNWSGAFALDFFHPEVRDYIRKVVEHYKAMGFTLFKLDFLYAVCMLPAKDKTRGEIMCEAMDFLREVCGDAQILGCGVPLASAFGKVEYCRIGPDMSLSYNDALYMRPMHRERPSTKHTQRNTVYRRQLNHRAFLNDPDVFLLRDENTTLTREQKMTLGRINALFGSVLFGSDHFGSYTEEKQAFYEELCRLQKAGRRFVISFQPGRVHRMIVRYELNGKTQCLELKF